MTWLYWINVLLVGTLAWAFGAVLTWCAIVGLFGRGPAPMRKNVVLGLAVAWPVTWCGVIALCGAAAWNEVRRWWERRYSV